MVQLSGFQSPGWSLWGMSLATFGQERHRDLKQSILRSEEPIQASKGPIRQCCVVEFRSTLLGSPINVTLQSGAGFKLDVDGLKDLSTALLGSFNGASALLVGQNVEGPTCKRRWQLVRSDRRRPGKVKDVAIYCEGQSQGGRQHLHRGHHRDRPVQ